MAPQTLVKISKLVKVGDAVLDELAKALDGFSSQKKVYLSAAPQCP